MLDSISKNLTVLLPLLFCGVFLHGQDQRRSYDTSRLDLQGLVVPGATLELVDSSFSFTEGASTDKQGNIFFTDQPNNRIWEFGIDGKLRLFKDSAGRSNGMYFDGRGNLISCADEKDQLWSIGPDGRVKVLLSDFGGSLFNGPNDCWVEPAGGIYFTDPYYQRPYWTRTKPELDGMKVYYLPVGGKEARVVIDDLKTPNGIVGSPDGKLLYVADLGAGKTYKYRINGPGSLSVAQLFVNQGSDGITLDERGNLYLTGNGVTVYDAAGARIAHIPVPAKWTANLCFGGKDKNELFITASQYLFKIHMAVKGVE